MPTRQELNRVRPQAAATATRYCPTERSQVILADRHTGSREGFGKVPSVHFDRQRFDQDEDDAGRHQARIVPEMIGTALDDDIADAKMLDRAAVEHQFEFAAEDDAVI